MDIGGVGGMAGEYRIIWLNTRRDTVLQNPVQAITAIYLHQGPGLLSKPIQGLRARGHFFLFSVSVSDVISHTMRDKGVLRNLENLGLDQFCNTINSFGLSLISYSITVNKACREHFLLTCGFGPETLV